MSHAQVTASVFVEEEHPRSSGGQFGTKSTPKQTTPKQPGRKTPAKKVPARKSAKRRVIPKGQLGFDGVSGTGYGVKGGDPRVRTLQAELNRLGLLDLHGRRLVVDGKLGPLTTSAIRAAQRRLGMKATGIVAPAFIDRLKATKSLPAAKKAAQVKRADRHPSARVRAKYNPDQLRDPDGKWGDGVGGTVKRLLNDLLRVNDGGRFEARLDPSSTIDWSVRSPNGDFSFEADNDHDFVRFDLPKSDLEGLHRALTEDLGGGGNHGHYSLAQNDDDEDPRYFDWSVTDEDADGNTIWQLEVGGDDPDGNPGAVRFQLTDQDMADLQSALTITLINDALLPPTGGGRPVTASGAEHVFDNGICVTCEAVTVS